MKKNRSTFSYLVAGAVAITALLIFVIVFYMTNNTATAESLTEDFPQGYKGLQL